jgi:hypothetical protein
MVFVTSITSSGRSRRPAMYARTFSSESGNEPAVMAEALMGPREIPSRRPEVHSLAASGRVNMSGVADETDPGSAGSSCSSFLAIIAKVGEEGLRSGVARAEARRPHYICDRDTEFLLLSKLSVYGPYASRRCWQYSTPALEGASPSVEGTPPAKR